MEIKPNKPLIFAFPYYEDDAIYTGIDTFYSLSTSDHYDVKKYSVNVLGKPYTNNYDIIEITKHSSCIKPIVMDDGRIIQREELCYGMEVVEHILNTIHNVYETHNLKVEDMRRCVLSTYTMLCIIERAHFETLDTTDPAAALNIKIQEAFYLLETDYGVVWTEHEKNVFKQYYPFFPFEYMLEFMKKTKLLRSILKEIRDYQNLSPLSATPLSVSHIPHIQRMKEHLLTHPRKKRVPNSRNARTSSGLSHTSPPVGFRSAPGKLARSRGKSGVNKLASYMKQFVVKDKEAEDAITFEPLKDPRSTILIDKQYYDYRTLFQAFETKLEEYKNKYNTMTVNIINLTGVLTEPSGGLRNRIIPVIPHNNKPLVELKNNRPEPTTALRSIYEWLNDQDPLLGKNPRTKKPIPRSKNLNLKPYPIFRSLISYFENEKLL